MCCTKANPWAGWRRGNSRIIISNAPGKRSRDVLFAFSIRHDANMPGVDTYTRAVKFEVTNCKPGNREDPSKLVEVGIGLFSLTV